LPINSSGEDAPYVPSRGIRVRWIRDGYLMHIAADTGYGIYENGGNRQPEDLIDGYIGWFGKDSDGNFKMTAVDCHSGNFLMEWGDKAALNAWVPTYKQYVQFYVDNSPPHHALNPEKITVYIGAGQGFSYTIFAQYEHTQVYNGSSPDYTNVFRISGYDSLNKRNFDYTIFSGGYEEVYGKYRICIGYTSWAPSVITISNGSENGWYGFWGGYAKPMTVEKSYTVDETGKKIIEMSMRIIYSPWNEGW
ncbi:MAG: hypothetical protein QXP01_07480, partial [Candidatus Hadarchaeum sp.]